MNLQIKHNFKLSIITCVSHVSIQYDHVPMSASMDYVYAGVYGLCLRCLLYLAGMTDGERPYFYELRHEVAAEVECHEGVEAPDARPADEHGRRRRGAVAGWRGRVEGAREGGDLVVFELDDGRVDTDGGEEILHDLAHAAGGAAEDYDGVLRYQPLDLVLRRLGPVDGEALHRRQEGCVTGRE